MSVVNQNFLFNPPNPHRPIIFEKPIRTIKPAKDNQIIEFSNSEKKTHKTKNFIVLYNGFPLKNKTFNLVVQKESDFIPPVTLPIFKTDHNGILCVLVNPVFNQQNIFNPRASDYQPVKFSNRLGFVIKDKQTKNRNIFYKTKYIAPYIDIGLGVSFLREMIKKSQTGNVTLDASESSVIQNWVNAFYNPTDISKPYRQFNTHTERTAKALRYTDYACNGAIAVGISGLVAGATLATIGIAPIAVAGIGGGIMAAGSSASMVDKYMEKRSSDISRLRDNDQSASQSLKKLSD